MDQNLGQVSPFHVGLLYICGFAETHFLRLQCFSTILNGFVYPFSVATTVVAESSLKLTLIIFRLTKNSPNECLVFDAES